MPFIDRNEVVKREYVKFDVPADRIPADPEKAAEFLQRVNRELPQDIHFSLPELNTTLINLRRKGEAKGGLPRLRRTYRGRSV